MATPFDHTSLESLEVGVAPVVRCCLDRLQQELLRRHPDLADELAAFFTVPRR